MVFKNNYGFGPLCLACYAVYKSISSMQAYFKVYYGIFYGIR